MKMHKMLLSLLLITTFFMTAKAQETKVITMLEGEKWWGSVTDLGNIMPFDSETTVRFNHQTQNFNNQTTPLLVSNKGRYIWSDSPFKAEIKDGNISLEAARGTIECVQAGANLREAFVAASKAHFPASGTMRARLPSGASAQRIIPSDTRPASLAGLRLVMTMTFLPTISSGV